MLEALLEDPGRAGPVAGLSLRVPRGGVRVVRDVDQRQAATWPAACCWTNLGTNRVVIEPLPNLDDHQGPGRRHGPLLGEVRAGPALAARGDRPATKRAGMSERAAAADRSVRQLHSVRAVLRGVPGAEIERRIHRPGGPGQALPVPGRLAGRARRRDARAGGRPRGRVGLPHDHPLHRGLPQERPPHRRHRGRCAGSWWSNEVQEALPGCEER